MRSNGWQGPPIDVFEHDGVKYILNGHHRVQAAMKAGIDVPYRSVPQSELPAFQYDSAEAVVRAASEAGPVRLRPR